MDGGGVSRPPYALVPRGVPVVRGQRVGKPVTPPAQLTLASTPATVMARAGGADTSIRAAKVAAPRTGSQKARLLAAYTAAGTRGLTDEEAAKATGLYDIEGCCWWKRCGDLRADGFIITTGAERPGVTGHMREVCAVTVAGFLSVEVAA